MDITFQDFGRNRHAVPESARALPGRSRQRTTLQKKQIVKCANRLNHFVITNKNVILVTRDARNLQSFLLTKHRKDSTEDFRTNTQICSTVLTLRCSTIAFNLRFSTDLIQRFSTGRTLRFSTALILRFLTALTLRFFNSA